MLPTPFSSFRCRQCGKSDDLVSCSAPGCKELHVHAKCHIRSGGFLLVSLSGDYAICLCASHKLRIDYLFMDNSILLTWLMKLAGSKLKPDNTLSMFMKDVGVDLRGKRLEVKVKQDWFKCKVSRQRSKRQVMVTWEDDSTTEWIELSKEFKVLT